MRTRAMKAREQQESSVQQSPATINSAEDALEAISSVIMEYRQAESQKLREKAGKASGQRPKQKANPNEYGQSNETTPGAKSHAQTSVFGAYEKPSTASDFGIGVFASNPFSMNGEDYMRGVFGRVPKRDIGYSLTKGHPPFGLPQPQPSPSAFGSLFVPATTNRTSGDDGGTVSSGQIFPGVLGGSRGNA